MCCSCGFLVFLLVAILCSTCGYLVFYLCFPCVFLAFSCVFLCFLVFYLCLALMLAVSTEKDFQSCFISPCSTRTSTTLQSARHAVHTTAWKRQNEVWMRKTKIAKCNHERKIFSHPIMSGWGREWRESLLRRLSEPFEAVAYGIRPLTFYLARRAKAFIKVRLRLRRSHTKADGRGGYR